MKIPSDIENPPRTKESAAVFSGSEAPHIFSHGNCGLCDTLLQVLTSFLLATTKQIHSESVHIYITLTLWQSLIKDSPCFQSPLQRQKRVTVWLRVPNVTLYLFSQQTRWNVSESFRLISFFFRAPQKDMWAKKAYKNGNLLSVLS